MKGRAENQIKNVLKMMDGWNMTKDLTPHERQMLVIQLRQIATDASLDTKSAMSEAADAAYESISKAKLD